MTKAIVIDDFGDLPSRHDLPVPKPAEGEVLVGVRASSMKGFDVRPSRAGDRTPLATGTSK